MSLTAATSTPNTNHTSHTTRSHSFFTTAPVWRVSVVAAVIGAVVTELFALAAGAIDVPMRAVTAGNDTPQEIGVGGVGGGVLFWSSFGIVLAVVLARRATRPARTFAVTTIVLTAVSLLSPIMGANTDTATEVTLVLAHIVAAAVIIPLITRRLSHVER